MSQAEEVEYWIALNNILTAQPHLYSRIEPRLFRIREIFVARRDGGRHGLWSCVPEPLRPERLLDAAKEEIDWLKKKGYTPVPLMDERYPPILREIDNPPLVLYCAGKVDCLREMAIAIVGARKPTPYGLAVTEKLSRDLASLSPARSARHCPVLPYYR